MTDGGSIFRANQARAVHEAAGITQHEIERGKPWQSYIETTFNTQRRMADWHRESAELSRARNAGVKDPHLVGCPYPPAMSQRGLLFRLDL